METTCYCLRYVKAEIDNFFAVTYDYVVMLNLQCNGYRTMIPSAFRLIPYKTHFHCLPLGTIFPRRNKALFTAQGILSTQSVSNTTCLLINISRCLYHSTEIRVSSLNLDSYSCFLLWTVTLAGC